MLSEQPSQVAQCRDNVLGRRAMVALDGDQYLIRLGPCCRLGALPPAPAARVHDSCLVGKDHLALDRMLGRVLPEVGEFLSSIGEPDGDPVSDSPEVEDGDGHPGAHAHDVADVDERTHARYLPVFLQPSEKRLGGVSVARGLDAERGKDPSPCDDARQRAQGLGAGLG